MSQKCFAVFINIELEIVFRAIAEYFLKKQQIDRFNLKKCISLTKISVVEKRLNGMSILIYTGR